MNKQTQTKMFDFSDTDLDFCSGSKNKFPDVFKKMLANGYNSKVVSSVVIAGDQVTLNYGVNHGYVADRVLAINTPRLVGEFYIDSVTTNTVTLTVSNAPTSIAGGFTTKIASLGYELVYELNNIHVYKFKAMDESDLYLRLCFQNNASYRNRVSPCIGKTVDLGTGFITDSLAFSANANILTPGTFAWEFSRPAVSTYNNYNYNQGLSLFGNGVVIGSKYHLVIFSWSSTEEYHIRTNAIIPYFGFNYDALNYPVLLGEAYGLPSSTGANDGQLVDGVGAAYIGNQRVVFQETVDGTNTKLANYNNSATSFLPADIDGFNTTTANLPAIYLRGNGQFVGHVSGGLYFCRYALANNPPYSITTSPSIQIDAELNTKLVLHGIHGPANRQRLYLVSPLEEIKIGN